MEDNLLHAMSKLRHVCSSMLSLKFFVYSKQHSAHSIHRDQRIRQVVAYRRLKSSAVRPKKWSRSLTEG